MGALSSPVLLAFPEELYCDFEVFLPALYLWSVVALIPQVLLLLVAILAQLLGIPVCCAVSVAQHRSFLAFANMISAFQSMPVPKLYQGQQLWVIGARGESGQALVYVKIEYTIPPICMCLDQIDGCRLRPKDTLVITKVETNYVQLRL